MLCLPRARRLQRSRKVSQAGTRRAPLFDRQPAEDVLCKMFFASASKKRHKTHSPKLDGDFPEPHDGPWAARIERLLRKKATET